MPNRKKAREKNAVLFVIYFCAVAFIAAAVLLAVQMVKWGGDGTDDTSFDPTVAPSELLATTAPKTTAPEAETTTAGKPSDTLPNVTVSPETSEATTVPNETTVPSETTPEETTDHVRVDPDIWYLKLVNPWNYLTEEYVDTIPLMDLPSSILTWKGQKIDSRIYSQLEKMLSDCRDMIDADTSGKYGTTAAEKAKNYPKVTSAFRTQEFQEGLFEKRVATEKKNNPNLSDEEARDLAAISVAIPGTSEHQLGLAVDIVTDKYPSLVNDMYYASAQQRNPTQQWLMANCHKYGFILRYEENTYDITGIKYEPWHYRYVGVDAATEIVELGITFEEWLALQVDG